MDVRRPVRPTPAGEFSSVLLERAPFLSGRVPCIGFVCCSFCVHTRRTFSVGAPVVGNCVFFFFKCRVHRVADDGA